MSSDAYFEDEYDSAFLQELDAIEAAQRSPLKHSLKPKPPSKPLQPAPTVITIQDSDDYGSFEVPEDQLLAFDRICDAAANSSSSRKPGPSSPTKPRSAPSRPVSKNYAQTTLDGTILREKPPSTARPSSSRSFQRVVSMKEIPKRTKQWDHTAFAKTGWKKPKSMDKGKGKASLGNDDIVDDWDDEPVEFEQFPAPQFQVGYVSIVVLLSKSFLKFISL